MLSYKRLKMKQIELNIYNRNYDILSVQIVQTKNLEKIVKTNIQMFSFPTQYHRTQTLFLSQNLQSYSPIPFLFIILFRTALLLSLYGYHSQVVLKLRDTLECNRVNKFLISLSMTIDFSTKYH